MLVAEDAGCERLMRVPGMGPIISSAIVAAIGNGDVFRKAATSAPGSGLCRSRSRPAIARSLAGYRSAATAISRTLLVQAARVVLLWPAKWPRYSLGNWLKAASKRLHHNVLAIALANKLARIAWSVLHHGRNFEVRKMSEAMSQPA